MNGIVLHPATKRAIELALVSPAHALALVGTTGIGKGLLGEYIARRLLGYDGRDLSAHPFFLHVVPDKQTIGIEEARRVAGFLRLKTTGVRPVRRVVLIEHAGAMTVEAQNALLKNIEEPPEDTVLLLTLDTASQVLPTIASRVQVVAVRPPITGDLKGHFVGQGFSAAAVERTLVLSDGLPGLAATLLQGDQSSTFVEAINTAKTFLAADTFARLTMVDGIVASKQTDAVIAALMHIAQAALVAGARRAAAADTAKKWADVAAQAARANDQLRASAQAKLVLTNLSIHI